MRKAGSFFASALLLLVGCSSTEDGPAAGRLASASGFCDAWAEAACNEEVVSACNARSAEDCQAAQRDFCLELAPEQYSSKHAGECLTAVEDAYADADLDADELAVVLRLAAPCDRLYAGDAGEGDSCSPAAQDCDAAAGFSCVVKPGESRGTCQVPVVVEPGRSCAGDAQICTEGFYCRSGNCVEQKAGGTCQGDYECLPELRCDAGSDSEEPGACRPRLELNEACTRDDDCQSRYCLFDEDEETGQCASRVRLSPSEPLCEALR